MKIFGKEISQVWIEFLVTLLIFIIMYILETYTSIGKWAWTLLLIPIYRILKFNFYPGNKE